MMMPRTFYTEYVSHCLRFYARHPNPIFLSEADKYNWIACKNALKEFSDENRGILLSIYSDGDTIPDNVYRISKEKKVKQDSIWKLINELERKVAKSRRLI